MFVSKLVYSQGADRRDPEAGARGLAQQAEAVTIRMTVCCDSPPERPQVVLDDCCRRSSGANMLDEEERVVTGERRHRGHEGARTGGDPVTAVRQVLPNS